MSALRRNAPGDAPLEACRAAPDWQPRCIKPRDWPEMDQQRWDQGCTAGSPFEPGGHGARLREDSREKVRKGYGAWLSFLQAYGWLDASQPPADRVTRQRLAAYFQAMRARRQAGHTILGRFGELRMATKILAPERDMAWILKPNGITIRAMLRPQSRALVVPDAEVLFAWGIGLMRTAKLDAPHRAGLLQYRDGLLIAILASRARRLRSMSLLRHGHEFQWVDDGYRIELQPEQVKTAKYDLFGLPKRLISCIDTYLETVRPALLRGRWHDELWIGIKGKPLDFKRRYILTPDRLQRLNLVRRLHPRRTTRRVLPSPLRRGKPTGLDNH